MYRSVAVEVILSVITLACGNSSIRHTISFLFPPAQRTFPLPASLSLDMYDARRLRLLLSERAACQWVERRALS
jgi:hypothetical protein